MLAKVIHKSLCRFAISKYSQEIVEQILPAAPQLNKPQVIDTEAR